MHIPDKSTVLVINAGSSSVKFTLFRIDDEAVLASGMVERIGLSGTRLVYSSHTDEALTRAVPVQTAREAVLLIIQQLADADQGIIPKINALAGIGHRVVHGGDQIHQSVIIDESVKKIIQECFTLAPLHNPPNLRGYRAAHAALPEVPHVAVFDTAFHQTMPAHAFLYGIPFQFYSKHHLRRYGFHGTSHRYVRYRANQILGWARDEKRLITIHLGNGCSMAAIDRGSSVDTTMGFTPLEGLLMGTRCGDIDPAVLPWLMAMEDMTLHQLNTMLNKHSGLQGVSGVSSDMREVLDARAKD
jgi:acetate kinase